MTAVILVAGLLLFPFGLIYGLWSGRAIEPFLRRTDSLGLASVGFTIFVAYRQRQIFKQSGIRATALMLGSFFFIPVCFIIGRGILIAFQDLAAWSTEFDSRSWRAFAPPVVVIAAGAVLFQIRRKLRACYGLTEAMAGAFIAAYDVTIAPVPLFAADLQLPLGLLTSVYLIVRGLDNVEQGLTKDPKDPLALRIVAWFQTPIE